VLVAVIEPIDFAVVPPSCGLRSEQYRLPAQAARFDRRGKAAATAPDYDDIGFDLARHARGAVKFAIFSAARSPNTALIRPPT
jgi:hypothetical protein